ncbi:MULTISPECIES: PPOX class F420-dependent oxidoreductase [unclassified Saccharopolyspora]|nr:MULTISPECIES: PPOX class F420-dependent oxidoreductase [unclassified Saccharopolyspora]MCA1196062.1 PPOX class F420-dependent oxidoreductase [Saccharopolyspora sp. 6V]MCA1282282.1 PPOX class F420-dependent oxidoreductase [Saccharopolyspora sp. 7B]
MAAIPQELAEILSKRAFAHIATLGPRGEPQSSPVWVEWDGTHVRFSQTTGRQKYRNLQRDPRIAVSAHDPENPYRYVEIRGRVAGFEPDPDNAFINKMAKKYTGEDEYQWGQPGDERVVVLVEPEHVPGA